MLTHNALLMTSAELSSPVIAFDLCNAQQLHPRKLDLGRDVKGDGKATEDHRGECYLDLQSAFISLLALDQPQNNQIRPV